ncbi:glycosyltransferase [Alphaproteobacteria bacterium]|nr:glycosyltransferase [Alphaproteobacteria bacterium]
MKISIITCTYNSAKSLNATIKSIRDQLYSNIEYILVDAKSEDDTLKIIQENSDVIDVWISEKDDGIYDAINKGINLSSGDLIVLLHSDDEFINPNTLKLIVSTFENSPQIEGIYGNLVFIDDKQTGIVNRTWKSRQFTERDYKFGWMMPHPTLILRRELFDKIGMYDPSFRISGDYEFVLRLLSSSALLLYVDETIIRMKTGGISTRGFRNFVTKFFEDVRAMRMHNVNPLVAWPLKVTSKLKQFRLMKMLQRK